MTRAARRLAVLIGWLALVAAGPALRPPPSATATSSGLAYVILQRAASVLHPTLDDDVTITARGWMGDGSVIPSPDLRGKPYTYHLRHLMRGWQEAVQLMSPGETARFWMPGRLTGSREHGNEAYSGRLMIFDIHLLAIHAHRGAEERPGSA
jgi:peptidylprolyl isomerase